MSGPSFDRPGLFEALPAQILRSIDHRRIAALVDDDARRRILAVMDELSVPVQTVCYECRLRGGDARVDVAVCLFAMRMVGAADVLGRLGQRRRGDAGWQRCLEFLAGWSSPASPLAPQIPFVCAAFDLPGDPAALPAPSLSLCVDPDFFAHELGLPAPASRPVPEVVRLAEACHDQLRGEPLPASCRLLLERCLSDEDGVTARHVSLMVSRAPATFKLDVRLPVDGVASLLGRIGWPGAIPSVVAGIRRLMPWQGHVQLNLVLHPALGSSLEVEFLTGRGQASTADRLALLRRLVDAGHSDPDKAEALRDAWASPVSRDGTGLGGSGLGGSGLIVARSWYVKVRFDGDGAWETKAYLGLMPRALSSTRPAVARGAARAA